MSKESDEEDGVLALSDGFLFHDAFIYRSLCAALAKDSVGPFISSVDFPGQSSACLNPSSSNMVSLSIISLVLLHCGHSRLQSSCPQDVS